jgi:hypothetical protein
MKIFRNAIKGQVDCKRWLAMLTEIKMFQL